MTLTISNLDKKEGVDFKMIDFRLLSSLGPGHLKVYLKSKRPGPGACSYDCNATTTHPPPP